MDERSKCDLPYGHFGRSDYDPINGTWRFERALNTTEDLRTVDEHLDDLSSGAERVSTSDYGSHGQPRAKRHAKQIESLVSAHPEFRAAAELLSPLSKTSEAVEEAARNNDALRGSLLSFARIWSRSSHHSVLVAAYVSGETACDLQIVQATNEKRNLHGNANLWLELFSLPRDGMTFSQGGAPIQQVRFATSPDGRNTFLAVRLLDKIELYQPILTGVISPHGTSGPLELNHLHSISSNGAFGRHWVDIAFNPWFPQQVGVIDGIGNWQVHEFVSRKLDLVSRSWSYTNQDETVRHSLLTDGWCRLSWVGDLETLVVCTRTSVQLFSISGQAVTSIQEVELPAERGGNTVWIMDFVALTQQRDHFCLVTSHMIVIYHVKVDISFGVFCQPKLRIRHFRNPEDLSLRVTASNEPDSLRLLLYSSATGLASAYSVKAPNLDEVTAVSPVTSRSNGMAGSAKEVSVRDVSIFPLSVTDRSKPKIVEDAAAQSSNQVTGFYRVFGMTRQYSLVQRIWYASPQDCQQHPRDDLRLSTMRGPRLASLKLRKGTFIIDDNDDDHNGDAGNVTNTCHREYEPISRRARRTARTAGPDDTAVNMELVAEQLSASAGFPCDLAGLLSNARDALEQAVSTDLLPIRTLSSFAVSEVLVGDVGDASEALNAYSLLRRHDSDLRAEGEDDSNILYYGEAKVSLPARVIQIHPELCDADMNTVYNHLVSQWISSLCPRISGWARLAKVELVRRVSAELVLTSRFIRVKERERRHAVPEAGAEELPSSQTWDLPMRGSGLGSTQTGRSRPPLYQAASVLPTPSPTATPSITTASSSPSNFAAPELLRLSKYTNFTKPTPSIMPRSLRNVLSHWKEGEDLGDYDWMSTSRCLTQKDEDAGEEMTEHERKRMQRRAERHIRRQRKEAAASQAQQLASSQAAEIFSARQPAAVKTASQPSGMAGSSQSQAPGPFVASQVISGRFGGRPVKKKRKHGF